MVGQQTLDLYAEVRILDPQPEQEQTSEFLKNSEVYFKSQKFQNFTRKAVRYMTARPARKPATLYHEKSGSPSRSA